MYDFRKERASIQLLSIGVPATSLFILTRTVTDPVNATKFLLLGAIGTAAFFLLLIKFRLKAFKVSRAASIFAGLFVFFGALSVISSQSPISQNIYGVYGRNTGFLTYLFLTGIFLLALTITQEESFKRIYLGMFFTGLVNVVYCAWVLTFGDFVGWNNPYGNILGLFGNPNFIGAFLGICISSAFGYFAFSKIENWKRIFLSLILLIACYEVYESRAVQGIVVTSVGIATVFFYYLRSRTNSWKLVSFYTTSVLGLGFLALLGALQRGPLSDLVYKTSVSLRGAYWNAGIETGLSNPFFGAGMDAYGDWYRRSRTEYAATTLPGPDTVTNSAHNVFIDIFAYGGFPLLFSYVGIAFLGALAILRNLKRTREFNPVFVSLSVAWIGYQLQSLISINQVGLAVWGWLLTGCLIAYEARFIETNSNFKSKIENRKSSEMISSNLVVGIGLLVGCLVATPPISADMAWMKATSSGNFQEVEKALTPSYMKPLTSTRLANAVILMENSKLHSEAVEYAVKATEFNPENFDAWFLLYSLKNTTPQQKEFALENMKRLDPFNPRFIRK